MRHCFVIRSKYPNTIDLEFNRRRLNQTIANIVPALLAQTDRDFEVVLLMDGTDPLHDERCAAYDGLQVLHKAPGGSCQTRVDDDDVIAANFVERLKQAPLNIGWYTFPEGYIVRPDGTIFRRCLIENQFVSRVGGSVYELNHRKVPNPTVIDLEPAWAWIQHADSTIPPHRMPSHCHGAPIHGSIHETLGVTHAT